MRPYVEFTKEDAPEDGKVAVVIEDVCGFWEHGENLGTILNLLGGGVIKVKEGYAEVKAKLA